MVLKSQNASVTGLSAEKRSSGLPLSHLRPHTRETPLQRKGQPTHQKQHQTMAQPYPSHHPPQEAKGEARMTTRRSPALALPIATPT